MSVIRILDEDVSNRIAAGEVIERPASIVKELVENSLDAGASRITINIERGGRSLVRVVDDGSGMDQEDALLCLEAHATSKVRTTEDIENIQTMGFRGEALPSIASVTRFTLRSRRHDSDEGNEVEVSGGTIRDVHSVGCAPGTSITARNLFFNMPARRKFLRTVGTEENHIQEMVLMLALANPGVGFELTFDQRPILTVQPNQDLRTRATMLLGRDLVSTMIDVELDEDEMKVYGFAARPGLTRSSRRDQRVFVNSRPVTDKTINFAIRDAYHTMVMKGRYPPVILFLELPIYMVDINVHPSKREVRFRDGRGVGRVVGTAIRDALRSLAGESARPAYGGVAPTMPQAQMGGFLENMEAQDAGTMLPPPRPQVQQELTLNTPRPTNEFSLPRLPGGKPVPNPTPLIAPEDLKKNEDLESVKFDSPGSSIDKPVANPEPPVQDIPPLVEPGARLAAGTALSVAQHDEILKLKIIGVLGNSYLLAEGLEGLVLVDQHAAHERIMFEKMLIHARKKDGASQGLLIPVTMDVSTSDAHLFTTHSDDLSALGFEISHFGGNTFMVNAIPPHFPQSNIVGVLNDILDELRDAPLRSRRPDEHMIVSAACKAAVKAHDHLRDVEVRKMLEDLTKCELPYTCPHGRPTMIKIGYQELEKRFGRRAP